MKKCLQRVSVILLTVAMILAYTPAFGSMPVFAADGVPDVPDVTIEDGTLTWGAVEDAASYQLSVDYLSWSYYAEPTAIDIDRWIDSWTAVYGNPGRTDHEVVLYVYNEEGEEIAASNFDYEYTPNAVTIPTVPSAAFDEESGQLTWDNDALPVSCSLTLNVDNYHPEPLDSPESSAPGVFDVKASIDQSSEEIDFNEPGYDPHQLELLATDTQGALAYYWTGTYDYDSPVTPSWNAIVFEDGHVEWADLSEAVSYEVAVSWYEWEETQLPLDGDGRNSCTFLNYLNERYAAGDLPNDTDVAVNVYAYDAGGELMNSCGSTYHFHVAPEAGDIEDVTIEDGVLGWTDYPDTYYYCVSINNVSKYIDEDALGHLETSCDLHKLIDRMILNNELVKSEDGYQIRLEAVNDAFDIIGIWDSSSPYLYDSPREPVEVQALDASYDAQSKTVSWDAWESDTYPLTAYVLTLSYEDTDNNNTYNYYWATDETSENLFWRIEQFRQDYELTEGDELTLTVRAIYCLDPDDDVMDDGVIVARSNDMTITYEPLIAVEIQNIVIDNGILSWDPVPNVHNYTVYANGIEIDYPYVDEDDPSPVCDLNQAIDHAIMSRTLDKTGTYTITIEGEFEGIKLAEGTISYTYDSPAEPIEIGEVTGIALTEDGQLSWDAYAYEDEEVYYEYDVLCRGDDEQEGSYYHFETDVDVTSVDFYKIVEEARIFGNADIDTEQDLQIIVSAIAAFENGGIKCAEGFLTVPNPFSEMTDLTASIDEDGLLTWEPLDEAASYEIHIDFCEEEPHAPYTGETSFSLNRTIDEGITNGDYRKAPSYDIYLVARDAQGTAIGRWHDTYAYESEAENPDMYLISFMDIGNVWDRLTPSHEVPFTTAFDPDGYLESLVYFKDQYWKDNETGDEIHVGSTDRPVAGHTYTFYVVIAPWYEHRFNDEKFEQFIYGGSVVAPEDYTKILHEDGSITLTWGLTATAANEDLAEVVDVMDVHSTPSLRTDVEQKIHLYTGDAFDFNGGNALGIYLKEDPNVQLTEGTDYTVSYADNTGSGTMTVTITGIGDYTGTVTKQVRIAPVTVAAEDVPFQPSGQIKGDATVTATVNGTAVALTEGTDYAVDYLGDLAVGGDYPLVLFGKGDYTGTVTGFTYAMIPAALTEEMVSLSSTEFNYDGTAKEPGVTIKHGTYTLVEGTDYTVAYSDNTEIGTATATVTGIGNYTGQVPKSFKINASSKRGWKKEDGYWYYYDETGARVTDKWMKDSKGWCYLSSDGRMVTNGWAKDSKGWCWIASDGYMPVATKWIQYDGGWYHITKGYRDENKWMKDSKGWCWLQADGRMLTNGWVKDSKGWCWIASNGYMPVATKWIQYDGGWYYIEKGYRVQNAWRKDSKGWCYLGADGRMVTSDFVKDSKGWCWIADDGYMPVITTWIGEAGAAGSYYIIDGYRVDGKTIEIEGVSYTFDANGKLVL